MAKGGMKDLYDKYKDRSSFSESVEESYTPSGSVIFDQVLSNGKGLPSGTWIQITSESGCGKSHLVLYAAKAMCARGKKVCYIDDEKGVNESQLDGIGLTPYLGDTFFLYPISTFEEAEEVLDEALEDEEIALIIIDSITGLVPQKCIENSIAKIEPGLQARYSANFLVKYRAKISMTNTKPTVLLINQQRTHISFMGTTSVGEAGGNAQKFYTDIRLLMKQDKPLTKTIQTLEGSKSIQYGVNANIWATKNRYAQPFVQGLITIIYGKGVSNLAAYQRFLMSEKVLKMSGAGFWSMKLPNREEIKARGSEGVLEIIKDNLSDIKQFIEDRGGFTLIKTEEGKEDAE